MDIEISRDLQHYKESFLMGLTVKQFTFSVLSLGAGAGIVLGLYDKIGMTLACYLATPVVVPIALTGFYNHNGLSFWQSTENVDWIKDAYGEEQKIATQQQKKEKKGLSDGQEDFNMVKKKAKRMILLTVGALVVAVAGILAFRLMK